MGRGITLSAEERATLERWIRSPASQQRVVRRSKIVLALAEGRSVSAVASRAGMTRRTVALWGQRFRDGGPQALLQDKPGRGRRKGRRADIVARIAAASGVPPAGRDRWSARALADHLGISHSTVLRVWRETGAECQREPTPTTGRRACQAVARSYACASASTVDSANGAPLI